VVALRVKAVVEVMVRFHITDIRACTGTFCATTILLREEALSFIKLINPV
jgi:hypothetical protein